MSCNVSVLIPALNEARNIEACLQSVTWSDDIVVVDSGSTDGTGEIARRLGARIVTFNYVTGGPKKKNWALENVPFAHEWVLVLDADERITAALAEEITEKVKSNASDFDGFYINRRAFFMGKWIRHAGYYPSWNLRLFRHAKARYELLPETSALTGDNEVHEHVLLSGVAGDLANPMDHFAYPTVFDFVQKHNRYSDWEARQGDRYYEGLLNQQTGVGKLLAGRRILKRLARRLPFPQWQRFIYHYILKAGILDGVEGFIFCRLLAEYEFLIWAKRRELAVNSR